MILKIKTFILKRGNKTNMKGGRTYGALVAWDKGVPNAPAGEMRPVGGRLKLFIMVETTGGGELV